MNNYRNHKSRPAEFAAVLLVLTATAVTACRFTCDRGGAVGSRAGNARGTEILAAPADTVKHELIFEE